MATRKAATTKKTTTRKPAAKKTTTAKKAVTRKAPVTKKILKESEFQSFRLAKETQSFITASITRQTAYWAILSLVILAVSLYILNIQLDILNTLEQIEQSTMSL